MQTDALKIIRFNNGTQLMTSLRVYTASKIQYTGEYNQI